MIFVMIMITASYLNAVTADNPWSMDSMFSQPILMLVLLGSCLMDTFITISAFLAFYKIHNLYCCQGNTLSLIDILKLYLKRYLRFAPTVLAVFFFGVYVMPWIHGAPGDTADNPIWYTFQEVLFYRCTERPYMLAKIFFYSNLYPNF
jgi:hypothetical protein